MSKKKVRKTKKVKKVKKVKYKKVRGKAGMMGCCNDTSGSNRPHHTKEHKTQRIKEADKKRAAKRDARKKERILEDHEIIESAVDKNWQQLTEKRDTYHKNLRKNRPDKSTTHKSSWFFDW